MLLPRSFYTRPDVVEIACDLLGKKITTCIHGGTTSGIICETEAYAGVTDRASHAFGGRRTERTEIMYAIGGTAYVYLCYGIHSLFNVVTNEKDVPHAVLIRGIIPAEGLETMSERTGKRMINRKAGTGPGNVSRLLGIHYSHTGLDLAGPHCSGNGPAIWIEDAGFRIVPGSVIVGPRVGVTYAGEDALKPYRFILPSDLPGLKDLEGLCSQPGH